VSTSRLLRRSFRLRRRGFARFLSLMVPAPVPGFDLLQFSALSLSEISRHFPMRFRDRFMDASPGGSSNLFQLGSRFIDDR
jgi:hypothetical protein